MNRSTAMKVPFEAALLLALASTAIALALLSGLAEPKELATALGTAIQVVVGITVISLVAAALGLSISIVGLGLTLGLAMAILSPLFFLRAAYRAVQARWVRLKEQGTSRLYQGEGVGQALEAPGRSWAGVQVQGWIRGLNEQQEE